MSNPTLTDWGKHILALGLIIGALPVQAGPPKAVQPPSTQLQFTANQKQWEKKVLFAADIPNGRLFMEQGRLVQALYDGKQLEELHHHENLEKEQRVRSHAYAVTFVGATATADVKGEAQLPGYNNYFLGNDPSRWASEVPSFEGVRYRSLYPGTDLHFYSKEGVLEYDFELAAGAAPNRIALKYDGQTRLRVVNGALHITTSVGTVVEQQPYAYQTVAGKSIRVACQYALAANNTVTFSLPKGYNKSLPLVIDPVLIYSSYTGSSASNYGYTATYDTLGNLYAGGVVFSAGYPTTLGAYDVSFAGSQDIGIMKFNPAALTPAASRLYGTYIGGTSDDHPHSLVVDAAGNLVVLGSTGSSDYPTSATALDRTLSGSTDIILSKLNATGSALLASTFLGGSGGDGQVTGVLSHNYGDAYRGDVTTDSQNNIYIASITQSTNFPAVRGFQLASGGGASDAVVAKLTPDLTTLVWSNYLGGGGTDAGYSVQLDSIGNVFVGGGTTGNGFPGTARGFKPGYSGGTADGFIARISSAGNDLVQSTYLGTSSYDQVYFVQLNSQGEVYAYGQTDGAYPISAGLYGTPGSRQFIHKLNPRLTSSFYSTAIGNGTDGQISPTAFLVDNCGQIMISGWGDAPDIGTFPVTADALQSTVRTGGFHNGNFYIAQLSGDARRMVYATFFGSGSSHVDGGTSRFDKKGIIYQSMCTGSGNLITTPNAWSPSNGSSWNNAAFKIDVLQLTANFFPSSVQTTYPMLAQRELCAPARFYFNRQSVAGTGAIWDFGNGQTSMQASGGTALYTSPGKYTITLTVYDSTSCLQSVTYTDTVRVSGLPRAAAGPDKSVCVGYGATLTVLSAGAGATYNWTPAAGLNTTSGRTVIATPTTTTQYIVRVNNPSGLNCVSFDTVVVTVRPPLTVSAGVDQQFCLGSSVTLTATDFGPGATYSWSPSTGLSSTSTLSVTAQPTATTRYTVTATDANGCTGQAFVTLTARPPLVVSAGPDREVCSGSSTTLTATDFGPGSTYNWTPALSLSSTSTGSVIAQPTATTRYTVTATDANGCTGQASVTLTIPNRPNIAATVSNPNLVGKPVTFINTTTGATGYRWDFGDNTPASTEVNPTHTYANASQTPYQARLTAIYGPGCEESQVIAVPVRGFELPNIITPNGDNLNDTFRPFVSTEPVEIHVFNRWGRTVFEQKNYVDGWGGADVPDGMYYYRITNTSGESWKGWLEVVH